MVATARPQRERRAHRRYAPDNVRLYCGSGDLEERLTAANYAKRLLNLSLHGACLQTTGRLRPGAKLKIEMRLNDLNGTLRSEARIVWADTVTEDGKESHRAGVRFVGRTEMTNAVRDFLKGADPRMVRARRDMALGELKHKSSQGAAPPRKRSRIKIVVGVLLVLTILYLGSFWGLVLYGRVETPESGISYRYPAPDSGTGRILEKVYSPLYDLFRKAGVELRLLGEGDGEAGKP